METNEKPKNDKMQSDSFCYDFKNMKFTGAGNALLTLLIICIFIAVLVLIVSFTLKTYVVPVLATAGGKKLLGSIGNYIKLLKGQRSP